MQDITKRFPGVTANEGVHFSLRARELHSLLGENGAGKTTLMNILFGLYRPDRGEIFLQGRKVRFGSPQDAINNGIGMVHQHFTLIEPLTVAQNTILGVHSAGSVPDLRKVGDRLLEISGRLDWKLDPSARVWQLSMGERQRVEVVKMLYRGAKVLILDEPTSILAPRETEELFEALKVLRKEGTSIVFISHKLKEVMSISDRITVLRGGRVVETLECSMTNQDELALMMIGRRLSQVSLPPKESKGALLEAKEIYVTGDTALVSVRGLSFQLQVGEILGIAGVAGNGQRELVEALAGVRKVTGGKVLLEGRDVTNHSTHQLIMEGLAYIPEDRLRVGIVPGLSVEKNLILELHAEKPFAGRFFINDDVVAKNAAEKIKEYDIKTPDRETLVRNLSGGNIQKVLLAKALSRKPRVLIAQEPTKGLDVGASEFIQKKLIEVRESGAGILLVSQDLDEILMLSDRVGVMYEGRLLAVFDRKEADGAKIGLLMGGIQG